jgi:SPP1 family predicted phage head-tail adaptor
MSDSTESILNQLKHPITIMYQIEEEDNAGGFVVKWKKLAKAWAKIKAINKQETVFLFKKTNVNFYEIVIRYIDGVKPRQKIIFGKKEMVIKNIIDGINNNFLTIIAEEKL